MNGDNPMDDVRAKEAMAQKFRVQTYAEPDDDGQWYCHVDLSALATHLGVGVEQVEGLRVGPFASRQFARRELCGKFRDLVTEAVTEFLRKSDGSIVLFEVNERRQEDSN